MQQIINIDFMTKSMAGKQLTYDNLKLYLMQVESIKKQAVTVTTAATVPRAANTAGPKQPRCFECDEFGHMANEYPWKGTGKKMCV